MASQSQHREDNVSVLRKMLAGAGPSQVAWACAASPDPLASGTAIAPARTQGLNTSIVAQLRELMVWMQSLFPTCPKVTAKLEYMDNLLGGPGAALTPVVIRLHTEVINKWWDALCPPPAPGARLDVSMLTAVFRCDEAGLQHLFAMQLMQDVGVREKWNHPSITAAVRDAAWGRLQHITFLVMLFKTLDDTALGQLEIAREWTHPDAPLCGEAVQSMLQFVMAACPTETATKQLAAKLKAVVATMGGPDIVRQVMARAARVHTGSAAPFTALDGLHTRVRSCSAST